MLFAVYNGFSQENPLPELDLSIFSIDHKKVDSSAHAIVLYEHGRTELAYSETERGLRVVHTYHVRIKLLDKEGDNQANISIPLFKRGADFDNIVEIKGKTYNYENNKLQIDELKKAAIFNVKISEYKQATKFTLPNIKNNSIIEYSFTLSTAGIFNFHTWNFQSDIPKIYSEYIAIIPATFDYNVNLKGFYKLSDQKSSILNQHFLYGGVRNDCSKLTYIMRDIPAFKTEAFMLAPVNYISAVNFELKSYVDPTGVRKNFTKTWKDVESDLYNEKSFGGQYRDNGNFKNIVPGIVGNITQKLEQAKVIYSYIQKNIHWNKFLGKYADKGVKKALESKNGNIADINLALISALKTAEIEAYPVIISTRENGIPTYLNPVISDFNSVICLTKIDGTEFLLDASNDLLPFGELSLQSINDQGRVIYARNKSEWIPLTNRNYAKKTYNIRAVIDSTGVMKGNITTQYEGLNALSKRSHIDQFADLEEYEEKQIENSSLLQIINSKVENLYALDNSLIESMDFEMNLRNNF
ncbi:MAG: transglutaminase domain-containing protein, partial [Sphingobacterium sp.]